MLHQALPEKIQVKLFHKKAGEKRQLIIMSYLVKSKKTPGLLFRELPLHAVVSAAAFNSICAEPAAFSRLLHGHVIVQKSI